MQYLEKLAKLQGLTFRLLWGAFEISMAFEAPEDEEGSRELSDAVGFRVDNPDDE